MIKYLQLPFLFDASKIAAEVEVLNAATWLPHYQKLHYEGDWSAIPLRSIHGKTDNIFISPEVNPVYADTIYLDDCRYIKEVLSSFHFPLQSVRLLKLNAGAIIKEHRDAELNFEKGAIRLHIPVITHEDVEFYLDKERIHVKPGECWYMNFNLPHSIYNKSNINRIHLVIDGTVNDWVREIFSSELNIRKEINEAPLHSREEKMQMIASFRMMNTETANRLADELQKEIGTMNNGQ